MRRENKFKNELLSPRILSQRQAQVTAFIIIGILIIAIIWIGLFFANRSQQITEEFDTSQSLSAQSDQIKQNIDNCVSSVTDRGMRLLGGQGFYIEIPDGGYQYDRDSAYWLKDTVNIMPSSIAAIQSDVKGYIDSNLTECVSFDVFEREGWDISDTFVPNSSVRFNEHDMGVEVNYSVSVTKEDLTREFSSSIYTPKIRFRDLYSRAADFVNNQLLRPDFDVNDPLAGYDSGGYVISANKIDSTHIEFAIADPESKVVDGESFTLKFIASFDINGMDRTYAAGSKVLYSPDRLGVLLFAGGSPIPITIRNYEKGSVQRLQTPHVKENKIVTERVDTSFSTRYPIYRFAPKGARFSSPGLLTIFLNSDQRSVAGENGLLYNGNDGWIPFPHVTSGDTISTTVPGFSEFAPMACEEQTEESHVARAKEKRGLFDVVLPVVMVIVTIVVALYTAGAGGAAIGMFGGGVPHTIMAAGSLAASGGSLTSLAFIGGLAVTAGSAYIAIDGFSALDKEKTITLTAKCDDEIDISLTKEDGGSCTCSMIDTANPGPPQKIKNGPYSVKAGQTYTMTATLKDFDWPDTSAKCECTATGLITTNNLEEEPEEEPLEEPFAPIELGDPILGCCISDDGVCMENYIDGESEDPTQGCVGNLVEMTCAEIPQCNSGVATADGTFSITTADGLPATFGRDGDEFLISYIVPTANNETTVTAIIKANGAEVDRLDLLDDGEHNDGEALDKTYANTWNANVLGNNNWAVITWDIEVTTSGVSNIASNVGTILIIGDQDCEPLGSWRQNATLDVQFVGTNYNDAETYQQDVLGLSGLMVTTDPFLTHNIENGINFHRVDNLFTGSDVNNMRSYAFQQCNYHPENNFNIVIVLDNNARQCTQQVQTVRLNPFFSFDAEKLAGKEVTDVANDFCAYIDNLVTLNPPKPQIVSPQNSSVAPGEIEIQFSIDDEEYPVDYQLLMNGLAVLDEGQIHNDSLQTFTHFFGKAGDNPGNWTIHVKAEDKRGNIRDSPEVNILVDDSYVVDFSQAPSIETLPIPIGGSRAVALSDYMTDPFNSENLVWVSSPLFSNCIEIQPPGVIQDPAGVITVNHVSADSCNETFRFEVRDEARPDRPRASDTIDIQVS